MGNTTLCKVRFTFSVMKPVRGIEPVKVQSWFPPDGVHEKVVGVAPLPVAVVTDVKPHAVPESGSSKVKLSATDPVSPLCFAACWGLTVVEGQDCFDDPWGECNCPEIYDPVCAVDSLGNYVEFHNQCYAECFGYTVVEDSMCNIGGWNECECEFDENEPFVCAVDSLGHPCYVPNACFAACWGLTVTDDSLCNVIEIDPEIDLEVLNCIDSLNIDENTSFQEALLLLSESCGLELPECISVAPLFENDSLFIASLMEFCDGDFGFKEILRVWPWHLKIKMSITILS